MAKSDNLLEIGNDIRESLKNLGFTDYYVNLYIGLISEGEQNARELSDLTGVPYSRIYKVLNEMSEKKIIRKIDGRPSTFVAVDPKTMFQHIKKQHEQRFEKNIGQSLPFLNNLIGDKRVQKIKCNLYEGKACFDHFNETMYNTARNLQVVIKDFLDIYPHIKSNLDFVYTKGVEVDLLLEERLKDHQILTALMEDKAKEQFKIRFIPYIQLSFVISDRKEGLQGFKGNFNLAKPHKKLFSIISSDHSLYIQYLNEMFKQMWETSFS